MKQAQLITIIVYAVIAWWHVRPRLGRLGRAQAATVLLWPHVFRYIVLYLFTAQREGYPISDSAALELVIGDLAGTILAAAAIILLRFRPRLGLAVSWLVIAETVADLFGGLYFRSVEPVRGDATGVWWLVFVFFAPLILVGTPLLAWQLWTRRDETPEALVIHPTRP